MNISRKTMLAAVFLALPSAHAVLPEPGFLVFGQVTGTPPWLTSGDAAGMPLDLRAQGTDTVFAQTVVAADGSFALRVPLDSIDPQAPGTSRPGTPLDLYLSGFQLDSPDAAMPLAVPPTGDRGTWVQLDIDLDEVVPGTGFSVANAQAAENVIGGQVEVVISLTRTAPDSTESVSYLTVEGTATASDSGACDEGDDLVPVSGVASFPPGTSAVSVPIVLCDNDLPENDETFRIRIANPSNQLALARKEGTVTITDDDGTPKISVGDIAVEEPATGTAQVFFTVRLNAPQSTAVTFDYATRDGEALAGQDYLGVAGSGRIDPGATQTDVAVTLYADLVQDDAETFFLDLSNPVGAALGDAEGMAAIMDAMQDGTRLVDGGDAQQTLDGPVDLAVTPDGAALYVANQRGESISRFAIDPDTGQLGGEANWTSAALEGTSLASLDEIDLAPGGTGLAVSAPGTRTVTVLAIDGAGDLGSGPVATDGALDPLSVTYSGLEQVSAVRFSPDGAHLYALGTVTNSVTTLAFDGTQLLMTEIEANGADDPSDSGAAVEDMLDPSDLAISADGAHVYVVAAGSSAVVHFARDVDSSSAGYGRLDFRQNYSRAALQEPALDGISRITLAGDGSALFVVSEVSGIVTSFDIGPDGALNFVGATDTAEPGTLTGASDIVLNDDESALLASSASPGSLHVLANPAAPRQVLLTRRDVPLGLAGARAIAAAPEHPDRAYVVSFTDNRVSLFRISVLSRIFDDGFENQ